MNPDSLRPSIPKTTNELTDNHTIIDVRERVNNIVQKVGIIRAIALVIIVVLAVALIIKKKRKG